MEEILAYKGCFVCGRENLSGLQAKFVYDGQQAFTEIVAGEKFEGYKGIYHGGVLSALLDEVMIKAVLARGVFAVTAELTVRFKRPVRTGERIRFIGRVVSHKGRHYQTEGRALGDDDQPYAISTGICIEAKPDLKQQLAQSID